MPRRRFVFFDVGNTLLFPNLERILQPLPNEQRPSLAEWQAIERRTKHAFDDRMSEGIADHGFWWMFHTSLLEERNALNDELRAALVENMRHSANWDRMLPGTCEALQRIGAEYGTAVISNADGKIETTLALCGIAGCFKSITDSGSIGYEKPHPVIFDAGLREMKANANESLYVGDVYSVDYVGAKNAGMDAVLFDVAGAYLDRGLPRVESLAQLEDWLKN